MPPPHTVEAWQWGNRRGLPFPGTTAALLPLLAFSLWIGLDPPASAFTRSVDFLHESHVHPGLPQGGVKTGASDMNTPR